MRSSFLSFPVKPNPNRQNRTPYPVRTSAFAIRLFAIRRFAVSEGTVPILGCFKMGTVPEPRPMGQSFFFGNSPEGTVPNPSNRDSPLGKQPRKRGQAPRHPQEDLGVPQSGFGKMGCDCRGEIIPGNVQYFYLDGRPGDGRARDILFWVLPLKKPQTSPIYGGTVCFCTVPRGPDRGPPLACPEFARSSLRPVEGFEK